MKKAQVRSIDDALALVRRMKEEQPKNREYGYLEDLLVKWQQGAAWDDLWGEGYTVLSLAVGFENKKIVEFILNRGVPKKMLDTSVPSAQSPGMLDLLLAHGANIDSRDVLGYGSVAETAADRCDKRMILHLLKRGPILTREDVTMARPLRRACLGRNSGSTQATERKRGGSTCSLSCSTGELLPTGGCAR